MRGQRRQALGERLRLAARAAPAAPRIRPCRAPRHCGHRAVRSRESRARQRRDRTAWSAAACRRRPATDRCPPRAGRSWPPLLRSADRSSAPTRNPRPSPHPGSPPDSPAATTRCAGTGPAAGRYRRSAPRPATAHPSRRGSATGPRPPQTPSDCCAGAAPANRRRSRADRGGDERPQSSRRRWH